MIFKENKIDNRGVGTSQRCGAISPPVAGTKMTLRCAKDWHDDSKHRALTGEEWDDSTRLKDFVDADVSDD